MTSSSSCRHASVTIRAYTEIAARGNMVSKGVFVMARAKCPQCGALLHLYNWRPECPCCGINMVCYKMQDRLDADADAAEAEHALLQPRLDRAKAGYVGSKGAVLRLVWNVLSIGLLFFPFCRIAIDDGIKEINIVSLIQRIVGFFKHADTFAISGRPLSGRATVILFACVFSFVCSILLTLLRYALFAGSCKKRGKQILITSDIVVLLLCAASFILFHVFSSMIGNDTVSLSLLPYAYIYCLSQVFFAVLDIVVLHRGIPVKYTPCFIGGIPAEEYFALQEKTA